MKLLTIAMAALLTGCSSMPQGDRKPVAIIAAIAGLAVIASASSSDDDEQSTVQCCAPPTRPICDANGMCR
jgi:hypothetical protein